MTDVRDEVAEKLRGLATIPAERIWGRARNIRIHDCDGDGYLNPEDRGPYQGRQTAFDPDSLGPEGNVWAGSPEDVAEELYEAGLLAAGGRFVGYAVMREDPMNVHEVLVSTASNVREDRKPLENHLAYVRAHHREHGGHPHTRFFIAEVREVPDAIE